MDYDLGFNRFSPDPDIADAWIRLQGGDFNPEDLRLLEHEYFESRFEGIFHTDYRTAHNATERSGRLWSPAVTSAYSASGYYAIQFSSCPWTIIAFSFEDVPHSCRKCCNSNELKLKYPTFTDHINLLWLFTY